MKATFAIFLITLFLFALAVKTTTLLHYFYQKKQITEAYCINKNNPELNCEGSCFISQQLQNIDTHPEPNFEYIKDLSPFISNGFLSITDIHYQDSNSIQFSFPYNPYSKPFLPTNVPPPNA